MEQVFIYLLKANGLLIFFWAFYKLLLQKETFYKLNRIYFLVSILISFFLPLVFITKIEEIIVPISSAQTDLNSVINFNSEKMSEQNWYNAINWFLVLFFIISIISLYKITASILKIKQLTTNIQQLEKHPTEKNIRISQNNDDVFSFHKWIILPQNILNETSLEMLIQHEKIHVVQKHSFDLIIINFLNDFFWFNPIIKLIRKDVNLNLEFLVDQEIAKTENNSYLYQKTLINFNQNKNQHSLINAFNSSDLKKRILMLNTKKSNPMKKLKIVLATPILFLFLGLFQIKTIAQIKKQEQENTFFTENENVSEIVKNEYKETEKEKKRVRKELKKAALEIEKAKKEIEVTSNEEAKTLLEHQKANLEIEKANKELEKANLEKEKANLEKEKANKEREKANLEREKANKELEKANLEREKVNKELEKANLEREKADREREKNKTL